MLYAFTSGKLRVEKCTCHNIDRQNYPVSWENLFRFLLVWFHRKKKPTFYIFIDIISFVYVSFRILWIIKRNDSRLQNYGYTIWFPWKIIPLSLINSIWRILTLFRERLNSENFIHENFETRKLDSRADLDMKTATRWRLLCLYKEIFSVYFTLHHGDSYMKLPLWIRAWD